MKKLINLTTPSRKISLIRTFEPSIIFSHFVAQILKPKKIFFSTFLTLSSGSTHKKKIFSKCHLDQDWGGARAVSRLTPNKNSTRSFPGSNCHNSL